MTWNNVLLALWPVFMGGLVCLAAWFIARSDKREADKLRSHQHAGE
jgi:hypothetical protein